MKLGCTVGCNGNLMVLGSVMEALSYNANCLMLYTGAPQNTMRRPMSELKVKEAWELLSVNGMSKHDIVVHAPYIVNLSNPDKEKRDFAIRFLSEEVIRTAYIGSNLIVLHPGAALKQDLDVAINYIASGINKIIEHTKELDVVILLETMAGKGTEVGRRFEELRMIIDLIDDKNRIGVCFDTCHVSDSGYDLNDFDNVINIFDNVIGLKYLQCFHINDSKNVIGSHKDRHANIGEGYIGHDILSQIIHDERFLNIPKILETPYIDDKPPYKEEIARLKNE